MAGVGRYAGKTELAILRRLQERIDPLGRMSIPELTRYCVRWAGTRLDHDLIWRDDIRRGKDWSPEELALVGTRPDAVVAAAIGRTMSAVKLKRMRLEIPRYTPPPGVPEQAVQSYSGLTSGIDYDAPPPE